MKQNGMKLIAALAFSVATLFGQTERPPLRSVTAVRNWSFPDISRVAVEVSGDFQFRTDRLHNPERVYFDILNSRPSVDSKRFFAKDLDDPLVKRVRIAETNPGITRVVLDLAGAPEVSASQLSNPNRLMIEVRGGTRMTASPERITAPPEPVPAEPSHMLTATPPAAIKPEPPKVEPPPVAQRLAAQLPPAPSPAIQTPLSQIQVAQAPAIRPAEEITPGTALTPVAATPGTALTPGPSLTPGTAPTIPITGELGKAARHTSSGQNSLTRALGLKIARVVIDPGHGGHDEGTKGPKGLVEKDLVLDVALRVGKLIEEHMGAEVIYTRTSDVFVPLEGRTALANEKRADLFLSIHANSSPFPRIAGVETFYLNFTDSKEALDVAARENASSQKSVFELQDIIQKITLHEKLDESKEFASRIQGALYSVSSRSIPGQKNRGVKKAPFVVLIGANMPSVLAEIGFVSNPREEALLKKPDYRQKVADSLFRGLSKYAESLSHFQMAQNSDGAKVTPKK